MTVVLYSGGVDSTVLLYQLVADGHQVTALSVDYGQTHRKEIDVAHEICAELGVDHRVTGLDTRFFAGSDLTGGDGGVVVPNRNLVLIALAGALAVTLDAGAVAVACHQGDHGLFPDCRTTFLEEAFRALRRGTGGKVRLLYPFARLAKLDVVRRGMALGVPFEKTWSCYAGGAEPCGECLACRERREALFLAGAVPA